MQRMPATIHENPSGAPARRHARRQGRPRRGAGRLLPLLAAVLGLFAGAAAHAALSAAPNPSTNGSYTVSWTAITGATHYQLLEDGAAVYTGTSRRRAFAGQAPGEYRYTLNHCITIHVPPLPPSRTCGLPSGFDALSVTVSKPKPKPTVDASFDKAAVPLGESAVLTWSSTDATRCSGRPHIGSSATSGSKSYTPQDAGTFGARVYCSGPGGTAHDDASVAVNPPPTVTASFSPASITAGGSATLTWDSEHATRCAGSPAIGSTATSGTRKFTRASAGTFRVKVTCTGAGGSGSATASLLVRRPAAPAVPAAIDCPARSTSGAYTVTWDASTGATRYELEERHDSGSWTQRHDGAATRAAFTGKAPGIYRYRAKACNGTGCSAATSACAVKVPPPAPGPIQGPASSATGDYTLTWGASTGATRYKLEERTDGGAWRQVQLTAATSSGLTDRASGTHRYRASACNNAGCGSVTAEKTVVVLRASSRLAATPNPSTNGRFRVSWKALAGASGYVLEERASNGTWPASAAASCTTATSKSFAGKADGSHAFRLRVCVAIPGPLPHTALLRPGPDVLTVLVEFPPPTPGAIAGPAVSADGSYTLTWSASAGAARHELETHDGDGVWSKVQDDDAATSTFDKQPSAVHAYRVRACRTVACSGWTATKKVAVLRLSAAPNPSADGAYVVSWVAVAHANRYRLQERVGQAAWRQVQEGASRSRDYTGKSPGAYAYRFAPRLGATWQSWSGPVTVTVTQDTLTVRDDAASVEEDAFVDIDVLGNDGASRSSLTPAIASVTAPGNGKAVVKGGKVRYTPNPNWNGADRFDYTATAGTASGGATVTVTVNPVNDPPEAKDDAASLARGAKQVTIDVLGNDKDVDGDALTLAAITAGPSHGAASIKSGKIVYAPAASFHASATGDAFAYRVSDGALADTARVTITGPAAPVLTVEDDAATVDEDTLAKIDVLHNDGVQPADLTLALASVTTPGNGKAVVEGGMVHYKPNKDWHGDDTFDYTATADTASGSATVTVAVKPVNDPPEAKEDAASLAQGATRVTIDVLGNDKDVDGDALTLEAVTEEPSHGDASIESGEIVYTPRASFHASAAGDAFAYRVSDGALADTARVTVTGPAAPVLTVKDDAATVDEDTLARIDVLKNDSVRPADLTPTLASVTTPGNGKAVVTGGMVDYEPDPDWNGPDTFEYTATAGDATGSGTVTVTVDPVNDAPTANDDAAFLPPGATKVTIDVLDNDKDVDGDALTLAAVATAPSHGAAGIESGKVVYTPRASFHASPTGDAFAYRVSDGTLADTARVTVAAGDGWNLRAEYEPHTSRIRVEWNPRAGATRYVLRQTWDVLVPAAVPGEPDTTRRLQTEHPTASTSLRLLSPGAHEYAFDVRACTGDADADCGPWSRPLKFSAPALKPPFLDPLALEKTTVPGNLAYDTGVTRAGDAYVNVPIAVAPGVAGLAPALSIDHGGGRERARALRREAGDTLGYGWRVGGLSTIHRCVVHGTAGSALALDATDRLCLDGEPLALVSGGHLQPGAGYRTLRESFVAVTLKGTAAAPWFEARLPDGAVRQYGNGDDSRLQVGTARTALVWSVNRETDAHGNVMTFAYHEDEANAVRHPMSIDYGAGGDAGVRFWYMGREDVDAVSVATLNRRQHLLLHRVDVLLSNRLVRQYRLASALEDGRRRLTDIQLCAHDRTGGAPQCLDPLEVDWTTLDGAPRLAGITDPMGRATAFAHGGITHAGAADEPAFTKSPFGAPKGAIPDTAALVTARSPKRVVRSVSRDDGIGGTHVTRYAYQGKGLGSTRHWGVLGFHATRVTDAASGIVTYTQYRHDFPYLAEASAVHRSHGAFGDANAETLSRSETEYAKETLSHGAGDTVFPYAAARTEFAYEGGAHIGTAVTTTTPTFGGGLLDGAEQATAVGHGPAPAKPPANAVWGAVAKYAPTQVRRRTASTVDFTNRTGAGRWLLDFPGETVLGHYADADPNTKADRVVRTTATAFGNTLLPDVVTRFPGDAKLQLKTDHGYDANGNVTSVKVSGANVAERESKASSFVASRWPGTLTNALGHAEQLTYDARFGAVATHADANGRTTTVVRDGFGRETSRTTPDGVTITTTYTRCGPCPKVGTMTPAMAVVVRSPIAPDTTRYLDMLGRTVRTQTVSFDGAAQRTVDVAYDARGRVASVSEPHHATATPSRHHTTYAYDHRDRVTAETRPGGGSVATAYARRGNGVRITRTETVATAGTTATTTRVKTSDYNILGELARATDAAGTTAAVATAYAYDASGLLAAVTVDGARKTVFGHDAAGNRTSVSSPNFGTATFAHTALGEPRARTDARSHTTTYAHDKLGRLVTATDADGESRWAYDGANGKGLPAVRCRSATANANCARVGEYRETLAWNADARPSKRTTEIADGATTHTYAHVYGYLGDGDANVHDGRLATVSYPSGLKVRREYNARGYLARLVDAASNTALETYGARDAYGNVLTESYGNGTETTRTFEAGSARPSGIKTVRGTTTLQDNGYAWRTNGILAERTAPGLVETFAHDGLDRLLTATAKRGNASADLRKLTTTHGTDRIGNQTALTSSVAADPQVTGMTYGARTNTAAPGPDAVTAATVGGVHTDLSYDAAGNVTRYDRKTGDDRFVAWDARGLAASVTEGASATATSPTAREEFRHGPSGARYLRTSTWKPPAGSRGGDATRQARTFYAGAFEQTHITAGNEVTVVSRTRVTDNVVHVREQRRTGTQLRSGSARFEYLHRDHLGSVELVTDLGGRRVLRAAYDPYGTRRAADWSRALTDAEAAALGDARPRGFTGHEHLDRVGLIHANGRLYDPRLGRYLSPDPAVSDPTHAQSWNGYAYVGNSPLSFTDPTGMVRAGPGCNVGGVMCLDDGGGHSDAPATFPRPYSHQVTIPVAMPFPTGVWGGGFFSTGGLPGEGGFGGFGWFSPPSISHASFNVSGVVQRSTGVEGQGPGDRPAPIFTSPTIGFIVSVGVGVLPGAGSVQSVVELATGYDYITGDEVHRGIALIGIAAGFAPGGKAALKIGTLGGRLGNATTRQHLREVANALEHRGWTVTAGGGRHPEEYIRSATGTRAGSSYPDTTATKGGRTLRINTVDTLVDGITPTARERRNAARMRKNLRASNADSHLLLISKPKGTPQ